MLGSGIVEPFALPYFRDALIEIALLSIPCGLIGGWVVLRGFAFHSHAVGTAAFPGLVLAQGIGFAAVFGAIGAAVAFTLLSVWIGRSRRTESDAVTALALAACLAAGVILASDVFGSGAGVDTLLFGSLLSIGPADLRLAAGAAALAAAGSLLFGHHWLAAGFDPASAARLRPGSSLFDAALLVAIGFTVIATLGAVGALLVSTLIVVPSATARLFATRVRILQLAAVALILVEGAAGLWLSAKTDAPPGATIAVVSGIVFLLALVCRALLRRGRRSAAIALPAMLLTAIAGIGVAAGAGPAGGQGSEVVATTTQVGDLVREIGGDRVHLTTILRPGTDPHEYEPRPSDVNAVARSGLLFRSGGDLDHWTEELLEKSGSEARIVDLAKRLPAPLYSHGHSDHDHQGDSGHENHTDADHHHADADHDHHGEHAVDESELDPHWWQDPVNVNAAARRIEAALVRFDPANAAYYRQRSRRFQDRTRKLSESIRACVATVPPARRKIVTDHDAFAYFTRRFGIDSLGAVMPALATGAQPSAGDLADLESTVRDKGVPAIFPQTNSSAAVAKAVARDTGIKVGRPLYADSLGPAGSPGSTLLGSLKANADALVDGISGGRTECFGSDG